MLVGYTFYKTHCRLLIGLSSSGVWNSVLGEVDVRCGQHGGHALPPTLQCLSVPWVGQHVCRRDSAIQNQY